jgi:hypothetical protein
MNTGSTGYLLTYLLLPFDVLWSLKISWKNNLNFVTNELTRWRRDLLEKLRVTHQFLPPYTDFEISLQCSQEPTKSEVLLNITYHTSIYSEELLDLNQSRSRGVSHPLFGCPQ